MIKTSMPALLVAASCLGAATAHAQSIEPGEWEWTQQIRSIEMAGVTPAIAKAMSEPTTERDCVSADKAAKGYQGLLKGEGECAVKKSSLVAGLLDAEYSCKGADGGTDRLSVHGTYRPTAYSLDFVIVGEGARPKRR